MLRTERDVPIKVVLIGAVLLAAFLVSIPTLPTQGNLLAALLVLAFGFLFSTVSSRITGLIGSSSNPVSGMTIATVIMTCLLFVALGWTGGRYAPVALSVGAIVCIAAANAGNTSQDLKTGYLVGATPLAQQVGLLIGVVVSALATGGTMLYLHRVFGIGSAEVAAPQATLMSTIITGLLMNYSPEQLRFVMVDPKRVELTAFGKIPHLAFSEIVVEMDRVVGTLQAVINEMENRYRRFAQVGVRNIEKYNEKPEFGRPLPYWVVVIDELADLMLAAPYQVEQQLVRLAQLARATGDRKSTRLNSSHT